MPMDGVRRNQPLLSLHGPKRSRSSAECLKPKKPGLDFLPCSFLPHPALPAEMNMTSDGKDYEHGCAQASQTERRDLCGSHKETITGSDSVCEALHSEIPFHPHTLGISWPWQHFTCLPNSVAASSCQSSPSVGGSATQMEHNYFINIHQ